MPERLRAAIEAWHEADRKARDAEERLRQAREAFMQAGFPVPPDLEREARLTRAVANEKLKAAVAAAGGASP